MRTPVRFRPPPPHIGPRRSRRGLFSGLRIGRLPRVSCRHARFGSVMPEQDPRPARDSGSPFLTPRTGILIAVVALAAAFFASRIVALRDEIGDITLPVDWPATIASLGLLVLGFCLMAGIWWLVLRGTGARYPLLQAFNSFALTQFSKYLPGGIWPILGRAALLPGNKTGLVVASIAEAGIKVVAALALSMLLIDTQAQLPAWSVGLILAALVVLLQPRILSPLLGIARRLTGRNDIALGAYQRGYMVAAVVASAATWGIIGLAYALFVNGFVAAPAGVLVGAFALAWSIGFLVVPVPAGIGVREVVLVLATTPFLTEPTALVLALAARVWWMAGDALFFLLGLATGRIASKKSLGSARGGPSGR